MIATGTNFFPVIFIMIFFFTGCANKDTRENNRSDSPRKGTIHISVDESFKPIIEEQIKMYQADFPGTEIFATYKTEADCFKDFFRDSSNRMIIVTRGLTEKEDKYMLDSLNYRPAWDKIANDAVCILINKTSTDTLFSLDRLQKQLTGQINREQQIVFDGLNATSTVRFIADSILHGAKFDTSVVKATRNSQSVIDYVSANINAIGLVGINWIGNLEDSVQVSLQKKVKIAYVQCDQCEGKPYVKPIQQSILSNRYPLVRGLYYVLKENYFGLGSGFINFLKYERGQLIFRRAYLAPIMDFNIRRVKINEK